jgi:D-inositol-3-phosphate glycosyltransferase
VTSSPPAHARTHIALLTGGSDKPYAVGITEALTDQGVLVDFIGSTELDCPEVTRRQGVTFLNLRPDQKENASVLRKALRSASYYGNLVRYAFVASPKIFHILWNNKFALLDRVVLMTCYRLIGRHVVMTAHNVNAGKRDGNDSWYNRVTLRVQYRLCNHIFVHTEKMKHELAADFGIPADRVSVIPFGINNTIPTTGLSTRDARRQLGVEEGDKVALFFGQIAPYKGLEYLIQALAILARKGLAVRLIVAGRVKSGRDDYWESVQRTLRESGLGDAVIQRIQFIPDEEVEPYFKAADAVVIPYTHIFQSGVPFLAYSFGLPVIATDVGSLRDDIVEGESGFLCPPRDPEALAATIERYFSSDLYRQLPARREQIRRFASEHHSWTTVGEITRAVYAQLVREPTGTPQHERSSAR